MYQFLWIFFVYAFLGWCMEVCFAALVSGKFVNRGFLNGPVCPIYGFGVVIVLGALEPLRDNALLLFLGAVVLTSLLELVTGFLLEKIFHQHWWDYSNEPFNIGGYICLRFSIAWGFACLFVVEFLHPTVQALIQLIPHGFGIVLLCVFACSLAVDLVATVRAITHLNRQLSQIDELAGKIKEMSNEFGENLTGHVLGAVEKGADLKDNIGDLREDFMENMDDFREDFRDNLDDVKGSIDDLREDFKDNLDDAKEELAQRKFQRQIDTAHRQDEQEQLRAKLEQVVSSTVFGQRRMFKAFPKLRSLDHKQALEHLKKKYKK